MGSPDRKDGDSVSNSGRKEGIREQGRAGCRCLVKAKQVEKIMLSEMDGNQV